MRFEGIKGEGVQPAAFSACGGEEWRFYWDCGVEWVWIVCTLRRGDPWNALTMKATAGSISFGRT